MFLEGVFNRLMRYRPYWYSLNLNSKWGMACCQIWLRVGVDNCGFRMYDFVKLKHIWRIEWAQFGTGPWWCHLAPYGETQSRLNQLSMSATSPLGMSFFITVTVSLARPKHSGWALSAFTTQAKEREKKNCKKYKSLNFEQDSTTFLKINVFF